MTTNKMKAHYTSLPELPFARTAQSSFSVTELHALEGAGQTYLPTTPAPSAPVVSDRDGVAGMTLPESATGELA